jgi:hypothetical protein
MLTQATSGTLASGIMHTPHLSNNINKTCVRSKDNMNSIGDMPMPQHIINNEKNTSYGKLDIFKNS